MKFLHTSDLHIGKTVCGFSMLEEQQHALTQIQKIVIEHQVDVVFLSGDLYDRALPPSQGVALFDVFLTDLIDCGILVCGIAGNHDSGERIGFANRILEHKGLHLEGLIEQKVRYVDWSKDGESVRIHLMPFARPAEVRGLYETEIETYEDTVKELLNHVDYLDEGKNILLTHHFVVNGGQEPHLSDSETRVSVGGADQVEVCHFSRFDYVALGHIHGSQQIGAGPVYYSGSPVKYSFSEVHHEKTVILGQWGADGSLQVVKIPIVPIHDMRKIRGKLEDLIAPEILGQADVEDYLLAVLTNEEELVDPIGTLRSVYPNVMQLQIERLGKLENGEPMIRNQWKEKPPFEMFSQFYEYVTGLPLTSEQECLMKEVVEQGKEDLL